jgi:hypothetical protein
MPLPIPILLQGEMFFDYTANALWIGTLSNGNQQIPLSTLSGILFPDATVQTTAATGGGAVSSVFGRTGAVVAQASDYAADYLSLSKVQTARVHVGVIASATPSSIISLPWITPFANNNYTVVGSVVVAETPSDGAATAICCIGMIQLQPAGAGINFVVCNADGVTHDVTAQFTAIHD